MPLQRGPVIGAEFEDGDPLAAKPILMANVLVRRDQNVEPLPLGSPQEIAHAALYLACDESVYATGSELVVDGGTSA